MMKRFRRNVVGWSLGAVTLILVAALAFSAFIQTNSAAPAAQAATVAQAATSAPATSTPNPALAQGLAQGQQMLDNFSKNFAGKLGVDETKLNSAFADAVSDTLDQAVKDGKLTQTQADLVKNQTKNGFKGLLSLPAGTNPKALANMSQMQEIGQYLMPIVNELSKTLNLSPFELLARFQADKSLADIAQAQNVKLDTVKDALVKTITTQLDTAVKAGKVTQNQADLAVKTFNLWFDDAANLKKSSVPTNADPKKDLEQYLTPVLNATAASLKLTPDQLQSELKAGKTFGQIATAQGVDLKDVKKAALDSSKTQLDAAAKAGKATQAQADKAYQTLTLWIDEVIK